MHSNTPGIYCSNRDETQSNIWLIIPYAIKSKRNLAKPMFKIIHTHVNMKTKRFEIINSKTTTI